jgi:hypothetical protein
MAIDIARNNSWLAFFSSVVMRVYRALFKKNDIFCCHLLSESENDYAAPYCGLENGKPIYAMIKAETEKEAHAIALQMLNSAAGQQPVSA